MENGLGVVFLDFLIVVGFFLFLNSRIPKRMITIIES